MVYKVSIPLILLITIGLTLAISAQTEVPVLYAVDLVPDTNNSCPASSGGNRLSITFDSDIETADVLAALLNTSIYEIWQVPQPNTPPYLKGVVDASHAAPVVITATTMKPDCCQKNIIYACTSATMGDSYADINGGFHLFRYVVNLNGIKGSKYPKSASMVLNKKPGPLPQPPSASFDRKESKGKDDSNVYVSGASTAGRHAKPDYTTDIKLRIPFNPNKPSTRFLFDLKTDTDPKSDADSLNIGVEYAGYIGRKQKASDASVNKCLTDGADQVCGENLRRESRLGDMITHYDWSLAGKIESDRRFRNTNLIGSGEFKVPIYLRNYVRNVWTLDPFAGIDLGRNLKSPVANAQSRGIARPYAGITTFVGILRSGKYFPVSFETTYTYRWPLLRELKLDKDKDGNLQALFFSKKARYFVDAKLNFQLNPFMGLFIGFQRGNLPPLYEQVLPTFKAGLTFKFKFKGADDN